jgi:hypothetical protein
VPPEWVGEVGLVVGLSISAASDRRLKKLDDLMAKAGLRPNGLHHEIYLSDVHEPDPAAMRTILR